MMKEMSKKEIGLAVTMILIVLAVIVIAFAVGTEFGKQQVIPAPTCDRNVTVTIQEYSGTALINQRDYFLKDSLLTNRYTESSDVIRDNITEYVFVVDRDEVGRTG